MRIEDILQDKSLKAKAKVAQIGDGLLNGELQIEELRIFAEIQNSVTKSVCIEAVEYASKKHSNLLDISFWTFVNQSLLDEDPKIKWESARVIGNVVKHFPDHLDTTIRDLLQNANYPGTVVRWATAYALAEILKLQTPHNQKLLPEMEQLCEREEDNGVKKKYQDVLKKVRIKSDRSALK